VSALVTDGTQFDVFVCIDWSGAAVARPPGLAVAWCEPGQRAPTLLKPADGWTRAGVLEWLRKHAAHGTRMLVGLDLSPGLPFADHGAYFPGHPETPPDARALWAMIDRYCADEPHLSASTFPVREGLRDYFRNHDQTGSAFGTGGGRLRRVEERQRLSGVNPVSCLNLVGAAQVGKSSMTGMRMLHRLERAVPVWPFDPLPAKGPLIVEIYTSIAARAGGIRKGLSKIRDAQTLDSVLGALNSDPHRPLAKYDDHSTDALITAAWLRKVAHDPALWAPSGLTAEIARTEGWTFGAT
jgi:hypothetical protein